MGNRCVYMHAICRPGVHCRPARRAWPAAIAMYAECAATEVEYLFIVARWNIDIGVQEWRNLSRRRPRNGLKSTRWNTVNNSCLFGSQKEKYITHFVQFAVLTFQLSNDGGCDDIRKHVGSRRHMDIAKARSSSSSTLFFIFHQAREE